MGTPRSGSTRAATDAGAGDWLTVAAEKNRANQLDTETGELRALAGSLLAQTPLGGLEELTGDGRGPGRGIMLW